MTGLTAAWPRLLSIVAGPALAMFCGPPCARAQAVGPPASVLEVVVVAPTPLPGTGIDQDKAPEQIAVLSRADIIRGGAPSALRALGEQIGAVNLDSAAGNPYQPTLFYHGFEASPLQGTSQGLAVYLNGVRFNQAFGDTVNWDLIPDLAIDRVTLEDSNPVFGLNALGGALNIQLKNGFTAVGGEIDLSGGAFGQREVNAQYGRSIGDTAFYLAVSSLLEDGWRDLQSSDIESAYGDFGWRGDWAEVHVSGRLAQSTLNGPGTAPVQLLAADPRAQFTAPNAMASRYAGFEATGDFKLNPVASVQAVAYYNDFHQAVRNGNSANDTPCDDGSGLLCDQDGDPSTTFGGALIPAFRGSSPFAYSELDDQTTHTPAYGATAQWVSTDSLLGMSNHAGVGASFDGSRTDFSATAYIGGLTADTRVFVRPGVVIDEPGQNIPVRVAIADNTVGLFATDTLDLTPRLSLTTSGRYNVIQIDLHDQLGGDLTGHHGYDRFNPAIGASYRATSWLTVYAGYAEANRAPTPAELSCAGPNDSCSLANFFVADPNLKQVTAHSYEAGLRGLVVMARGTLNYSLGLYRTDLANDIVFVNSVTTGRAFFTNVGATRRQGFDADLGFKAARWSAYLAYSHTEAAYRTGFVEPAGGNPNGDIYGDLTIAPGDHFPGVPPDQVKLGLEWRPIGKLTLGAAAIGQSGAYLFGDEANVTPKLPGFFVINLNASYQAMRHLQVFVRIENATNARFYTYGAFSPTTSVFLAQAPTAANPRSYSPAAPVGEFGGVRVTF